jgi:hypothetical protein
LIESVFSTLKRQMRLETHLAKTPGGLLQRIAQRLLALTLGVYLNTLLGWAPRALMGFDDRDLRRVQKPSQGELPGGHRWARAGLRTPTAAATHRWPSVSAAAAASRSWSANSKAIRGGPGTGGEPGPPRPISSTAHR